MGHDSELAFRLTALKADADAWKKTSEVILTGRNKVAEARRLAEGVVPLHLHGEEVSDQYVKLCETLWHLADQGAYIHDYFSRALTAAIKAYRDAEEMNTREAQAIRRGWKP
ncbi:hypothetical protein BJF79_17770 [Actinomadura sp. CNU-125]|uniref:hypothetical protein n=1 Tax=Actinomadura sp. CNU-125 TaxID=1904961 RepID=UPI0009631EEB|nr:hypothetical protein [Actinomadura sp. CNU-125]OLT17401.1 hypothetical protein BJF79_17770 [Actinomadura sp. CNU-125]